MSKPAGVQIRFWFVSLVSLLLLVDLTALTGSVVVTRSIRTVAEQAAPTAAVTGAVRLQILSAQKELFRYLSELTDDTAGALSHLDALSRSVAEARALELSPAVLEELDKVEASSARYRKVLELLPGTVEGSRDWTRLQEYSETAVQLGRQVEERVTRLAEEAQSEIQQRNREATRVATGAMWVSVGALAISLVALLALRHWWKRFQELILGF